MSEFNRLRGSSKFFLVLFMPVLIIYLLGHIARFILTDSETKVCSLVLTLVKESSERARQTTCVYAGGRNRLVLYVPNLLHCDPDELIPRVHGHLQRSRLSTSLFAHHCPLPP